MKTGKMSRKIDPAKWLKWKKTRLIYLYRDIYNVLKFGHGCAPLAAQKCASGRAEDLYPACRNHQMRTVIFQDTFGNDSGRRLGSNGL